MGTVDHIAAEKRLLRTRSNAEITCPGCGRGRLDLAQSAISIREKSISNQKKGPQFRGRFGHGTGMKIWDAPEKNTVHHASWAYFLFFIFFGPGFFLFFPPQKKNKEKNRPL